MDIPVQVGRIQKLLMKVEFYQAIKPKQWILNTIETNIQYTLKNEHMFRLWKSLYLHKQFENILKIWSENWEVCSGTLSALLHKCVLLLGAARKFTFHQETNHRSRFVFAYNLLSLVSRLNVRDVGYSISSKGTCYGEVEKGKKKKRIDKAKM